MVDCSIIWEERKRGEHMLIQSIEYKNLSNGLEMKNINFEHKKTLMVGNSGAGKTRILKAIDTACRLASGKSLELTYGFEMTMCFSILNSGKQETQYRWEVETDFVPKMNKESSESNIIIIRERLSSEGGVLFERKKNQTYISGYDLVPETKETESLISQYRKVKLIGAVYKEFRNTFFRTFEQDMLDTTDVRTYEIVCGIWEQKKLCPLGEFGGISISPFDRYGILKKVAPKMYDKLSEDILDIYQEIFPEVTEISYCADSLGQCGVAIFADGQWITQANISSGMLKALWSIINIFILPKHSVLLIDELENGLGINCIEGVSEFIMSERSDLQVIATSHHPYIINSIVMENWLIVQRKNQVIETHNADEFALGRSKHDAYLQLVNKLQSM